MLNTGVSSVGTIREGKDWLLPSESLYCSQEKSADMKKERQAKDSGISREPSYSHIHILLTVLSTLHIVSSFKHHNNLMRCIPLIALVLQQRKLSHKERK